MNKTELETMLQVALDHRKRAYKLRLGSLFISHINHQIRKFQSQLAELEQVVA